MSNLDDCPITMIKFVLAEDFVNKDISGVKVNEELYLSYSKKTDNLPITSIVIASWPCLNGYY